MTSHPKLSFDLERLRQALQTLKTDLTGLNVKVLFPVKSFPQSLVLEQAATILDGFDISNSFEYSLIKNFGGEKVIWQTSPSEVGLPPANFVSCQSEAQLKLLLDQAPTATSAIRLNVDSLSQARSRFGWPVENIGDALAILKNHKKSLEAVSLHQGYSDNKILFLTKIFQKLKILDSEMGHTLKAVNLGGAFSSFDIQNLKDYFRQMRTFIPSTWTIYIEPGAALSAAVGQIVGTVLDISIRSRQVYVTCNISGHCHTRWSKPRLLSPSLPPGTEWEVFFVGPTCAESDIVASVSTSDEGLQLLGAAVGTNLRFGNISGYSAAWNSSFNGIAPAEIEFLESSRG